MSRCPAKTRPSLAPSPGRHAALTALAFAVIVTTPARAASLSPAISAYTTASVPSYITMFEYVPANPAPNPPILVAAHYCSGNASAMLGSASSVVSAADQHGFVMIFPQTSNNCWDVGSSQSLTHDGGGDTQAIAEMVKYSISNHGADASRVYVMGVSSGAMMTEALLAVYPDVFKAGVEFSGVPAGCWAASYNASNQWSGPCASGMVSKTPQQWGDLVRAMDPGYSGYRPRIQLWHGTADNTINYNNMTEAIKEWTNVLGLSTTATTTDTPMSGYTRDTWQNSCGFTVLQAWTQQNGGHTTPVDAAAVISFFGLDKTGPDPQVAACGDAGQSGSSSSSGSGSGSGGSTDAGPGTSSSSESSTGSSDAGGSGSGVSSSGVVSSGSPRGSSGPSGPRAGGGSGTPGGDASLASSGSRGGAGAAGGSGGSWQPDSSGNKGCACSVPPGAGRSSVGAFLEVALLGIVLRSRRHRLFPGVRAIVVARPIAWTARSCWCPLPRSGRGDPLARTISAKNREQCRRLRTTGSQHVPSQWEPL